MRFKQYILLRESSRILYHYTNNLNNILSSDSFYLTNALLSQAEASHLPKGNEYPFFLSLTRNPVSGSYRTRCRLTLDGDRLRHRYPIIPVDYWNARATGHSEQEDRLWSKDQIIKKATSYIKTIELYVPSDRLKDFRFPHIPSALSYISDRIPVYLYTDEKSFFSSKKENSISLKDKENEYAFQQRDYSNEQKDLELVEFLESGKGKNSSRFRSLQYYPHDFLNSLYADISNMRLHRSMFYNELNKRLVNLFRQRKSKDVLDFLRKSYNIIYNTDRFKE